jgi:serine phosphatase RsbU (regulator of sigma subunit)
MHYESLEELVGLPEREALRRHFAARNYRGLRHFAAAAALVAFLFLLFDLIEGNYLRLLPPVAVLALSRWLFVAGEGASLRRHFRSILVGFILVESGLLVLVSPSLDHGMRLAGFLVTLLVAAFRLRTPDYVVLLAALWLLALGKPLTDFAFGGDPPSMWRVVLQTVVAAVALYLGTVTTRRDEQSFLRRFKIESSRNRERLRMRQELDYARQIQLSMLPRRDPRVPGLDIAAMSLPATEVGGDYYEYFESSDSQLCVVVGDVAGHGVASGLLLSGIRSCLHLLQDERPPPVEILRKLDRMVRQTTDRRMFITLLYAIVDPTRRQLTVATAGHPPVLHYAAATGTISEVGQEAPPLGTRLDARYGERTAEVSPGDVLLLYTDGVQETINQAGDLYGDRRLVERLERTATTRSAREIREAVLSDLWNFKGDAEQLDDITLIVIRVAEAEQLS